MISAVCSASTTSCLNGGYPDPSDVAGNSCNRCLCPTGFGGTLCDAAAPGSSKVAQYTTGTNGDLATVTEGIIA